MSSLQTADKRNVKANVKQLKVGYNKKQSYCFYDGILSKVKSVTKKKDYKIYTATNGYIAQKGKYTSHGKTIKTAIQDLEFKFIADKLKKEPITKDTIITPMYYHTVTGACKMGIESWMRNNNIEADKIKAKDLLPILEKTNAYGYSKFKSLIAF